MQSLPSLAKVGIMVGIRIPLITNPKPLTPNPKAVQPQTLKQVDPLDRILQDLKAFPTILAVAAEDDTVRKNHVIMVDPKLTVARAEGVFGQEAGS